MGDIDSITRSVLGNDSVVIYKYSLPNCARIIEERRAQALVIPSGHADHNTVRNLENQLGIKIPVPIFKAFNMPYSPDKLGELYGNWLRENFTKP
jgi:hypothetical protein